MQTAVKYDRAAVALSVACIAHCIALPLIASVLPFIASLAEAEWVHWILTALAILASSLVIFSDGTARAPAFLISALSGMVLLIGALFAELIDISETLPTVLGGMLLASAHFYRLFRHS